MKMPFFFFWLNDSASPERLPVVTKHASYWVNAIENYYLINLHPVVVLREGELPT